MSSPASDYVNGLIMASAAVLCGDPTNGPHFEKTEQELRLALGTEGERDLEAAIAEGDLLATVYRLGKAMVGMGEGDKQALEFAAQVAPQHRMPEHMTK